MAINETDLKIIASTGLAIFALVMLLRKERFFISFDEEGARLKGRTAACKREQDGKYPILFVFSQAAFSYGYLSLMKTPTGGWGRNLVAVDVVLHISDAGFIGHTHFNAFLGAVPVDTV
ncbi:MAG: hypothetical protein M1119_08480 [Firmicutes bacterium]|nr:hypothetical protein [Bacillota bacterium]